MKRDDKDCNSPLSLSREKKVYHALLDEELLEKYDRKMEEIMFGRQEAGVLHNSPEWAEQMYDSIKNFDQDRMRKLLLIADGRKPGILAEDEIRSEKNIGICMISAYVNFAIRDKLIDSEYGYSITDACIQMIEQAEDMEGVVVRIYAGIYKLAEGIQNYRLQNYNQVVKTVKDYIYEHLHETIVIEEMAKKLGFHPAYLSRLFRQVEGVTLKQYITTERIERARNMLRFSDYSATEISRYLGFSSQSHFAEIFKKEVRMTPTEYRKSYQKESFTK